MSAARTTLRLAAFMIGTAALLFFALKAVPATTLGVQGRMMVFVLGVPWLVALLVAHPRRMAHALATLTTGRGDEGLTTARTLDLIGALTMAVGAVGAFGTHALVQFAVVDTKDSFDPSDDRAGVALAMAVAPAFALLVRFVLYEPVVVPLRRRHAPEGKSPEGRATMHTGWKVILIVAATVLAVAGFRALFLSPPPKAKEPARDTSFLVVGTDPETGRQSPDLGPDHPAAGKPIRVEIARGEKGVICRVDGEPIAARPGQVDELFQRLCALKQEEEAEGRRIEIEAAREAPFGALLSAVDACNRVPTPGWAKVGAAGSGRVRVLMPCGSPLTVPLELRMVHEVREEGVDVVFLALPVVASGEKVTVSREDSRRIVNITFDPETAVSEIYVRCDVVSLDELLVWLHRSASVRRDPTSGVSELEVIIHCDAGAPVRRVYDVLHLLACEDVRVHKVLIAVLPPRDDSTTSGLTYE